MSAINDALRRASSAAKTTSAEGQLPPTLPPMPGTSSKSSPYHNFPTASSKELPPIVGSESTFSESQIQPRRKSALPFLFALLVLLCVFGAGASYLHARKNGPLLGKANSFAQLKMDSSVEEDEEEESEEEIRPAVSPAATTPKPGNSAPTAAPAPTPVAAAPAVAPAATPATRPVFVPPPAPAAVPAVPVRFPALKLQSIYYRPMNPSVMINGKTLYISDEISGVTVADITPSSVTLVLSGQTNILTLR